MPEYRYTLERAWDGLWLNAESPRGVFVMLNPSTADAEKDDPTIRKCMGFARRWGWQGFTVVNLFAYRATDPADLWVAFQRGEDIFGPENEATLAAVLESARGPVVAAWGAQMHPEVRARLAWLLARFSWVKWTSLGLTKDGHPRHPLMTPYSGRAFPIPWRPQW